MTAVRIGAATLETQLRSGRFDVITRTYLHRATRETGSAMLHGRDALLAAALAEAAAFPDATTTLGYCADDLSTFVRQQGDHRWRGHRWLAREGDRIVHETLVEDGQVRDLAAGREAETAGMARLYQPLGELRPGRGQFAAGEAAIVPPDWPAAARAIADVFHQIWNAKAIDLVETFWHPDAEWHGPAGASGGRAGLMRWLTALFAAFPDATLLFERAIAHDNAVALLWRLHAHHRGGQGFGPATGRRIRLVGSSVLRIEGGLIVGDETLLDMSAIAPQLTMPIIVWRATNSEGLPDGNDP